MSGKLRKWITIVCAVVFAGSVLGLCWYFFQQYRENQVDSSVAGLISATSAPTSAPSPTPSPEASPSATPEPTPHTVLEKYAELYAQNPDTIGWLKIDGTAIDYVVMQTPDDPDKYLHIDFYGNYSNRGTLYMDAKCDIWSSDNLIIYGHHMKSSAMFGTLDWFADKSYWEQHKYITFDTIYEEATYEIVGAFYSRILYQGEDGFRYYQFIDADGEAAFNEYRDFIRENACYDTGVDIAYGDRLLTLSTCAYQTENGRFAVVAKKVVPTPAPGETEMSQVQITDDAPPFAAEPAADAASDAGTVTIADEPVPLSAAPAQTENGSFSIDLSLLGLALVACGTAVLRLCEGKRRSDS